MGEVAKMNAVELPPLAPQSESAAIISMIERMASDPTIDIARLEKILELRERVNSQNERRAFDAAFAAMQPDLPVISEKGEIKVGNEVRGRYAKWADIGDATAGPLAKHGFALRHRVSQTDTKVVVTGVLSHREGHSEETSISLPIDTSGSKNAVQAIGSSVSYGQRYTGRVLLNLRSRFAPDNVDDDGRASGATEEPWEMGSEDIAYIKTLLGETNSNEEQFLLAARAASIEAFTPKQFKWALDRLNQKKREQSK